MSNREYTTRLLAPYQPQRELSALVVELNQVYHSFEAAAYDRRHPEITAQLPPLWRAMVEQALQRLPRPAYRVLDFGCGTGFEAIQLLTCLGPSRIARLTCCDPSPEMLARCRAKVAPLCGAAVFCSDLDAIPTTEPYDLLLTNALLHHLPDPAAEVRRLLPLLTDDALWLAGHEPSARFYRNADCLRAFRDYQRVHRWRRLLQPRRYWRRLIDLWTGVPARHTAQEAVRRGLLRYPPPPDVLGAVVDYCVAISPEQAAAGRGLDFEALQQQLAPSWSLVWVQTYAFMGHFYVGDLPGRWADVARELAGRHPHDGASFSALWSRNASAHSSSPASP